MADPTNCPKCGRSSTTVKMVSGGEVYIGCGCPGEPKPTLADVMHEIKALREVCTRHAELLLALTNGGFPVIHKDMRAFIHEGEAIWPRKYPEPIGVDEVGQPIFPEAGTPEAGLPPSSQSGDAAPQ